MKALSICVMHEDGQVVKREDIAAHPETLLLAIAPYREDCLVGLETGSTSSWLYHALQRAGVRVVCMEAHHARKALSAQPVKNDRNDAEGLAQLLRMGWYKDVHVKCEDTQCIQALLTARDAVKRKVLDIKNCIRGIVKPFGITGLPANKGTLWVEAVRQRLKEENVPCQEAVEPLLGVYLSLYTTLCIYDKKMKTYVKQDDVCTRLMTMPGVGPVNALAFKATIEHAERFAANRDVGAYLGLTPRLYASGEIERKGHITAQGAPMMRSLLFEAAQALLRRTKAMSTLKSWGLRLCKKKPTKVVITAMARKMAVLMLAIWKNGTTFVPVPGKILPATA